MLALVLWVPGIHRITKHHVGHPQILRNQMRLQNVFGPIFSRLTCQILSSILQFVCVEAPIKAKVSLSAIGNRNPIKTMHVQSISHWAPANIGPYSQATLVSTFYIIKKDILQKFILFKNVVNNRIEAPIKTKSH